MKFDMSAAWGEAMRILAANRQVIAIIAGVFFFLPAVIYGLAFTNQVTAIQASQGSAPDMDKTFRAMVGVIDEVWWVILLTTLVQWFGMLILVVLWTDRARPTVGEAIRLSAALLLPLLGAQLLLLTLWGLLILIPAAAASAGAVAAALLMGVAALFALVYTYVKFSLTPIVIGAERIRNPLTALGRSWKLTKGNTLRLLLFIFLLAIAMIVVSGVASMLFGLVFALAGPEVALIGQTFVSGIVSAVFAVVLLAALVAIYRQLAGAATPEAVGETFS